MKPIITTFTCIVLTSLAQSLFAQTQTEFPIGVFSFYYDTLNYTELRDSLHLNWIVGYGGDTTEHRYVEHQSILKFITARNRLINLDGSATVPEEHLFPFQNTRSPDTIIYLPDATIYFYDKDISRLKALGIIP